MREEQRDALFPPRPPAVPPKPEDVRILWVDFEATSADPRTARPLELAAALTDGAGSVLDSWGSMLWRYPKSARERMDDGARAMHEASGLADLCFVRGPGDALLDAEPPAFLDFLRGVVAGCAGVSVIDRWLGGRNVHYDHAILQRIAAPLLGALSYRHMDTGVLERACAMSGGYVSMGRRAPPADPGTHRAADDVRHAVEFYRWFVCAPPVDGNLR